MTPEPRPGQSPDLVKMLRELAEPVTTGNIGHPRSLSEKSTAAGLLSRTKNAPLLIVISDEKRVFYDNAQCKRE